MKLSTLEFSIKIRRSYPYICVLATSPAGEDHEFFIKAGVGQSLDNPVIIASKVNTLLRRRDLIAANQLKNTYISIFLANRDPILEALNEAKLDYVKINNIAE